MQAKPGPWRSSRSAAYPRKRPPRSTTGRPPRRRPKHPRSAMPSRGAAAPWLPLKPMRRAMATSPGSSPRSTRRGRTQFSCRRALTKRRPSPEKRAASASRRRSSAPTRGTRPPRSRPPAAAWTARILSALFPARTKPASSPPPTRPNTGRRPTTSRRLPSTPALWSSRPWRNRAKAAARPCARRWRNCAVSGGRRACSSSSRARATRLKARP